MSSNGLMATAAFDAALRRARRLSPLSAQAARLVLVDGRRPSEAARLCGIRYRQQVYRAVNCIRRAAIVGDVCSVCGSHVDEQGNEGAAAALAT